MKEETQKILTMIEENGLEIEIWKILNNNIEQRINALNSCNKEYRASIRAIKKINNGRNKAIDALCE